MDSEKITAGAVLTEEHLRENAAAYIPLGEKEKFIKEVSMRCFDKLEIADENGEPLPPFYKESPVSKVKYMMAALLKLYLRIGFDTETEDDPWSITEESFDAAAQSFLFSQLERMKKRTSDRGLQDKIYDLLADYKALEKLLNAECYGLLPAMNDTVSRIQMMMSAQTTPEAMEALMTATEEMKRELDEMKTRK